MWNNHVRMNANQNTSEVLAKKNEQLVAALSGLVSSAKLIAAYARRAEEITDADMSAKLIYEELESALAKIGV